MVSLVIGRRKYEAESVAAAAELYCALRDESGQGARDWPSGAIRTETDWLKVSYNGRVWRGPEEVFV